MSGASESELWTGARIGVFGGTFDPPHVGHVRMAAVAHEVLSLDRVLFSVAPHPPHKHEDTTGFPHRLEMVRIALSGTGGAALTRVEASNDPSYTSDLVRACRARTDADLYFILGADSLAELPSWKDPATLLRLTTLVVFPRDRRPVHLGLCGDAGLVVFDHPVINVSSTDIRRRLARGERADEWLSPGVGEYIRRHALYRGGA